MEIKTKSIGNQNQFQWKSKRNPLEIKMKSIGNQNEIHWISPLIRPQLTFKASGLLLASGADLTAIQRLASRYTILNRPLFDAFCNAILALHTLGGLVFFFTDVL